MINLVSIRCEWVTFPTTLCNVSAERGCEKACFLYAASICVNYAEHLAFISYFVAPWVPFQSCGDGECWQKVACGCGWMPLMGGLAPLVSALFCVSWVWNAKGNRVRQDSDSGQCRLLSVTPFKDPPIYQYVHIWIVLLLLIIRLRKKVAW